MVSRVASPSYNNPVMGFRRYLDENSFLRRFLVEELAANVDAWWSVHMYKDRDSTRFHTGPVWDFDLAFENDIRVHPVAGNPEFLFLSPNTTSAGNMRDFVAKVIGVEGTRMRKLWSDARNNGGLTLENLNLFLDSMQTQVYESQKLNFVRWPIMNQIVNQNYQITGSYEGEMKVVRDFLEYRLAWMDNKVGLIPVGIEGIKTRNAGADIVAADGGIEINGLKSGEKISIYDMSGMETVSATAESANFRINLTKGLYIVRIVSGNDVTNKKIMVR